MLGHGSRAFMPIVIATIAQWLAITTIPSWDILLSI
jgi:hypothetical protein